MSFIKKNALFVFLAAWLLLHLFQAASTELMDDEAYYWVYSLFLDWGYYDHPPMIAVLIKAGYALFENELGVRLFPALLSTATLYIIYQLLPRKNDALFFILAASVAVLQIGGIAAAPDIPLAFFTALFFLAYKRFLQTSNGFNGMLLGFVMAGMLYSKYHGVLIILFTFLSNLSLVKKPAAWLAVVVGVVLFIPHLYWQYTHHFPSVQYHLFERNSPNYKFSFTVEYVLGQIALAGPFMGWLLLWKSFVYKTTNLLERALKFSLVGFYGFFLLTTLKGRVEANWTIAALVPLLVISHQALIDTEKWKYWLWRLVPVTIFAVMVVRIFLVINIPGQKAFVKSQYHNNKTWAAAIAAKTGNTPLVFLNSYQKPSKYLFYTGKTALALNTQHYRRNNFNYFPIEKELQGKTVRAVNNGDYAYFTDTLQTSKQLLGFLKIDSFYSYASINITVPKQLQVVNGQLQNFTVEVTGQQNRAIPSTAQLYFYKADKVLAGFDVLITQTNGVYNITNAGNINLPPGNYTARICLPTAVKNYPTINSTFCKVTVQ
jgi:Dolichyl-phosphate-mannose-protein mannosyltransferase